MSIKEVKLALALPDFFLLYGGVLIAQAARAGGGGGGLLGWLARGAGWPGAGWSGAGWPKLAGLSVAASIRAGLQAADRRRSCHAVKAG